jgi:hypothetical protein
MGMFGRKKDFLGIMPPDLAGPYAEADSHGSSPQKKSGFFSKGGGWRDVLGTFGDVFSEGPAVYQPMIQARQNRAYEEQQAQAKRQQEEQDFRAREEYKRANQDPYRFRTNNGSMMEIGPDGQPKEIYRDPNPRTQWERSYNPDGSISLVDRGAVGQQGAPDASHIQMLLSGQGSDEQFDEAYGPGAAARVRGGQARGPETFPGQ